MADIVKKAALPFQPFSVKEKLNKLKIFVYGDENVGKTVLAGSLVKVPDLGGEVLFCDIGANISALISHGYDDLISMEVLNYSKGEATIHSLLDHVIANPDAFAAIVIDNFTKLQQMVIAEELVKAGKKETDLKVWNSVVAEMRNLTKKINSLPIHAMVMAHEKEKVDERNGTSQMMPEVVGQFAKEILGYFDAVGRMFLFHEKEGLSRHILHFDGKDKFIARDNLGSLKSDKGNFLVDTTMSEIFSLIKGAQK